MATLGCGGKSNNACPSGYICTPVGPDGGPAATSGGGAATIATLIQVPPRSMASDGTTLFWTDSQGDGVFGMPVEGGTIKIAVDASSIYWSDEGGNIMRLAK